MKKTPLYTAGFFAAAIVATVFSCPLPALAAGSVEDLKPAAVPVPTAEEAAEERAARPGRIVFDEFSVIGDPLYRLGSMELLKKAVKANKEEAVTETKDKVAAPAVKAVKPAAVPAVRKAVPSKSRPPSDLRDAPSGRGKSLPVPRIKSPAPKATPADPVAPRKAS